VLKRKAVDVLALSELHKTGAVAFVGVGGAAKGMPGDVRGAACCGCRNNWGGVA